jgi:hypothetical protein
MAAEAPEGGQRRQQSEGNREAGLDERTIKTRTTKKVSRMASSRGGSTRRESSKKYEVQHRIRYQKAI